MKEKPILFSGAMVRAILDGRKTQTRRIIKPQPFWVADPNVPFRTKDANPKGIINFPYGGMLNQRLWVRETFHHDIDLDEYFYKADCDLDVKWRPSIYMPRIASRLLLQITNVRVERLNEISELDAMEEGLKTRKYGIPDKDGYPGNDDLGWSWCDWDTSPILAYKRLWESINGKGSWDLNPHVWIIDFKPI